MNSINSVIDHRYSRQAYSIGQDVMLKLSFTNILIIGYNTLAQEIIKNLVLSGIAKISICFKNKLSNNQKTGLYYPVDNTTVPIAHIQNLNPTIIINQVNVFDEDSEFIINEIKKYNLIIFTNCTLEDAKNLNRITHKASIPLIVVSVFGLMGYVFNDFGENFTVYDIDGDENEPLFLEEINDKILKFKEPHKLSNDETIIVTFQDNSVLEYNVYRKKSPILIELKENPVLSKNAYKSIIRKKISKDFSFKKLDNFNNIEADKIVISDYSVPFNRSQILYKFVVAYNKYLEEFNDSPRAWSYPDFDVYKKYFEPPLDGDELLLAKKFCFSLRGDVLPFCSIIGAIASQEVLKALGHKYIPIQQWYFMDYLELITDEEINKFSDITARNFRTRSKYEGLVNVFGKKCLEDIQKTKPFIVGSGAIGCELIKNLGLLGVKKIYLADPDHIEKSNLSRQFLFSDHDIRKSKAETAAVKIKVMNDDCNVVVYPIKVCKETENTFNKEFHDNVDIYLNALDNVDARIYMDKQAILNNKPLIDSGTMGSKGNIQVIVPDLTETYGSSKDPDDKNGVPICTIKSFPYKPEHTIQWARELFETEFNQLPSLIMKYRDVKELEKLNDNELRTFYRQIIKYKDFTLSEDGYFKVLSTIFIENFDLNIRELIEKYSKPDGVEELGEKKLPTFIESSSELIREFITYGTFLLNQVYKTNIYISNNHRQITPIILESEHNLDEKDINEIDKNDVLMRTKIILQNLSELYKIDFDKDDDDLGHVHFITICANMRNTQYSIPITPIFETRKIAGSIIPAMITTTSLISGFQVLEYIKLIKHYKKDKYKTNKFASDIDIYKNRFVNLNINYCDGINPSKTQKHIINNGFISEWTIFYVSTNIVSEIINNIEKKTNLKVEFITAGSHTVYDGDKITINTINNINEPILVLIGEIPLGIPVIINI